MNKFKQVLAAMTGTAKKVAMLPVGAPIKTAVILLSGVAALFITPETATVATAGMDMLTQITQLLF